jgi:hypothetical protein
MAAGDVRGAFSMSEPGLGSDVSAIRTRAVRDGEEFVIDGQKMWLTNGGTSNLVAVLCRTDEGHQAPHRNMTTFLIEKDPGFGPNAQVPGLTVWRCAPSSWPSTTRSGGRPPASRSPGTRRSRSSWPRWRAPGRAPRFVRNKCVSQDSVSQDSVSQDMG